MWIPELPLPINPPEEIAEMSVTGSRKVFIAKVLSLCSVVCCGRRIVMFKMRVFDHERRGFQSYLSFPLFNEDNNIIL